VVAECQELFGFDLPSVQAPTSLSVIVGHYLLKV